mgnify:CR=1 FL=1
MKKKPREFHDNESENVSGESIGGAALIRGRRLLTFMSQMRRLFEGGAYSSKYGTVIIIINLIWNVFFFVVSVFDLLSNLTTPGRGHFSKNDSCS